MAELPLIVALLVLMLFAALGMFAWLLNHLLHGKRAVLKRRMAQIAVHGAIAAGRDPAARRKPTRRLPAEPEGRAKKWAWRLREQLMQAGLRIDVRTWLALNFGLAALVWGGLWLMKAPPILGPAAGLAAGFGLPQLILASKAKRRVALFTSLFADGLDVMVRGLRSGLPLGECLNIIGREMPEPLGSEFRLITEGQKLGLSLEDVVERAVERTPTADFRYFAVVLTIQRQTGGNLAETLAKLSEVLRARKRMRDKIKAFSSEATASALIIGSLPVVVALLLTIIGPDYIAILFTTDMGKMLLFAGFLLMLAGGLVMRKMINFDL